MSRRSAIAKQRAREARILHLYYVERMRIEDIGAVVHRSRGAVLHTLHRYHAVMFRRTTGRGLTLAGQSLDQLAAKCRVSRATMEKRIELYRRGKMPLSTVFHRGKAPTNPKKGHTP